MARLYLIRRNLETFIGPMTIEELVKAYERMDFGLQDEVAGHCGKWIALDDLERLKKHYAELAHVVKEHMLGGWGMSDHTGTNLAATKNKNRKAQKQQAKRPWSFFAMILLFASGAAISAFFIANHQSYSSRLSGLASDPRHETANSHLESQNLAAFNQHMQENMAVVLNEARSSLRLYQKWIPYLRAYAYQHDGQVSGLSAKMLRGRGVIHAPQDCSLNAWSQRWQASETSWPSLTEHSQLWEHEWAKIFFWDPHWIARRQSDTEWISPKSYYEACLEMAQRSLQQHLAKGNAPASQALPLQNRLNFLLATVRRQIVSHSLPADHFFDTLTCVELAANDSDIATCLGGKELSRDWQEIFDRRRLLNQMRIILDRGRPLGRAELSTVSESIRLGPIDPITQFDYQAELRFYRNLIRHNGNIRDALRQVNHEFPHVDFQSLR